MRSGKREGIARDVKVGGFSLGEKSYKKNVHGWFVGTLYTFVVFFIRIDLVIGSLCDP